jgi:hypothetical protein
MTNSRWARFTRGWVVAAFSVFVAALSHSFAGGTTPSWLAIALALAFASMLSIALSGGRARAASAQGPGRAALVGTGLSVAGSQLIFHGLFSLLGAQPVASAAKPAAALGVHLGHQLSSAQIVSQLAAITPQAGSVLPSGAHHEVWMLLGHSIAGVLTIAAVLRGEQTVRGLVRTASLVLGGLAMRPIAVVPIPDAAAPQRIVNTLWIPRPLDVVHAALRHRGPPLATQL